MKIKSKLIIGFSLMVFLTIFLGIITNSQSNIASDDFRTLAEHDLIVIQNAERLIKYVVDSETGQRGFIITGDETFLEPYNFGTTNFFKLMKVEKGLVSKNPEQVKKLNHISKLFDEWINTAARPEIKLAREIHQTQVNDLELLLSANSGKIILDEIYQTISVLKEKMRDGDNVDGFLLLTKIENDVKNSESSQRGYLVTGKNEFLLSFDIIKIELYENIQNLEINLSNDSEKLQLIYSIDRLFQKWEQDIVIPEMNSRRTIEQHLNFNQVALLLQEGKGKEILDEIRIKFNEFIQSEVEHKDETLSKSLEEQEVTRNVILIILVTSAVVATLLGFLIFYSISGTLTKLKRVVEKFEAGQYNEAIEINSNDELEEFSKSFETIRTILLKKEKLKNIGELSSRLAHDLRNPLTVIKGATQLIKMDINNEKKSNSKRIEMITSAISRMTHQINDVMDFVRVTELKLEKCSLLELIESAISRIKIDDQIEIQITKEDIMLTCDPIKLDILFVNIISNAVDAIKTQGTIKIRLFDYESNIKIEIEDSGPEILPNIVKNMFEPLFTTKEKGTGLGLSSCKNIVEQHNGEIWIETNPTIVSISLPKISS